MKEVTKEVFKAAYVRYMNSKGKPWEESWSAKLDCPHRKDVRYYLDATHESENGGIVIKKFWDNNNKIEMLFASKEEMNSLTDLIEETIEEAKQEKEREDKLK